MVLADFTLGDLLLAMTAFFFLFMFIWVFITIFADIFTRHDIGGGAETTTGSRRTGGGGLAASWESDGGAGACWTRSWPSATAVLARSTIDMITRFIITSHGGGRAPD